MAAISNDSDTFEIGGDLTVNRLGFGAMRLTGDDVIGPPTDEDAAREVIRRAVDCGVDFIDTADSYGPGVSERLLGAELSEDDGVAVASKAGLIRTRHGDWLPRGDPEFLRNQVLCSLDRLGVDSIDLYQFHRPDPDTPFADSVHAFAEMKDAGQIDHVGLSNVSVEQVNTAREIVEIATVQNRYNVANRDEEPVLEACEAADIGFIPWGPLYGVDDEAAKDVLNDIADAHDASPQQVALAWLLDHSPVTVPIPGTSSLDHLEQNVAAGAIDLTDEELVAGNALVQSGTFLAILALIMFMWWNTWGIAGGYANWGSWFYHLLGIYDSAPGQGIHLNGLSVSNIGLVIGAFASALLSRQFGVHRAPRFEYFKGFSGGILMGVGASLAMGCNVGGFYSAMGMLDLGGVVMMLGLFIGAYLGLRYLLWEMEHINTGTVKAGKSGAGGWDWNKMAPYIGGLVFVLVILAFQTYSWMGHTQIGGVLFLGFLIGVVMHRGRFCFANAFREPFMTGDSTMMRGVIFSLLIYALGAAAIKWAYIQPPGAGIYHPFWMGSMAGGIVFGFGMLLAGGCASGSLWRAGEGHLKLWLAIVGFFLVNAPTSKFLEQTGLRESLGKGMFMPDVFTWQGGLSLFLIILILLFLFLRWNEETEKFVAF